MIASLLVWLGRRHLSGLLKKLNLVLLITIVYNSEFLQAQDPHLAHIHASPTFLNPAMTGLMNQDLRLIANYRSQWNSFTNGYQTAVASADMKTNRGFGLRDDLGVGIQIMADRAGDLNLSQTAANLTLAYLKAINHDGSHLISAGIQAGFVQRSIDLTKVRVFDEDPELFGSEFGNGQFNFDVSAGFGWFMPVGLRSDLVYLGVATHHINRPLVSFFSNEDDVDGRLLYQKVTLHGGASFQINRFSTLKPSFIIHDQGPHREFNFGTFLKIQKEHKTYIRPEYAIYFGGWFRWSNFNGDGTFQRDAFIGSIRYDYRNTIYTFSFDVNVSDLSRSSRGLGGPEVSILRLWDFDRPERRRTRVKCPEF